MYFNSQLLNTVRLFTGDKLQSVRRNRNSAARTDRISEPAFRRCTALLLGQGEIVHGRQADAITVI